jgi:leader peptidase (prepilin peptidase)/N-methyltransferase
MIWLLLVVLGLCLGSFVNALTWRLHEQEELVTKKATKKKKERLVRLSIATGRSMCPTCDHTLAAKDLVPILSWLTLKGKCRYCSKPISIQYPLVELLTAGLFVVSYAFWPVALHDSGLFTFVFWLVFLTGFMALTVYDIRWFLLPTRIIRPLVAFAIVQVLIVSLLYHGGICELAGALLGALVIGGLFYVLFMASRGAWIGGGDVRLGLLLGLLVGGPMQSLLLIFIASTLGTIFAFPLLIVHRLKRTSHMPFGPFLLAGAIITTLFGSAIVHWYKSYVIGV